MLAGVAIVVSACSTSLRPLAETGSQSTIRSTTSLRTASSWSTRPKMATSTIASGTIEKSTRYEIPAACCGQRSEK